MTTLRRLRSLRRPSESEAALASTPLPDPADPAELDPDDIAIASECAPHTLTSPARVQALLDAVAYCVRRNVPGAFAECGVWRGGSVLAMILKLQRLGVSDRTLQLYDTFEGMTEPSEHDTSRFDRPALATWNACPDGETAWPELFRPDDFNEARVRDLLVATGYPAARLDFVRGPVEETLPARAPEQLALLRLDTDWYESTRHELVHLYPRLAPGGVLIIDDYGHWDGARLAVDEYFSSLAPPIFLHRIDYTGRIGIKG